MPLPPKSSSELPIQPWVLLAVGYLLGQSSVANLEQFYAIVDTCLVPLYTALVVLYLGGLLFRKAPSKRSTKAANRSLAAADSAAVGQRAREGDQPINMTGAYKLVQIENFEAFLEVQGKYIARRFCNYFFGLCGTIGAK